MQPRALIRLPALVSISQLLLCGTALAVAAPPASNGSSGSFYAVLGSGGGVGYAELFNTDTGQAYFQYGGGWNPSALVPLKVISYNGKKRNA